jgi:GDPmannose 4,6-dehydratase
MIDHGASNTAAGHRRWILYREATVMAIGNVYGASQNSAPRLLTVVDESQSNECFRLPAHSFVSYSFDDEFSTLNTNINGTHSLLSAIKARLPDYRFYFAASSEMCGRVEEIPQRETSRLPQCPRIGSAR